MTDVHETYVSISHAIFKIRYSRIRYQAFLLNPMPKALKVRSKTFLSIISNNLIYKIHLLLIICLFIIGSFNANTTVEYKN